MKSIIKQHYLGYRFLIIPQLCATGSALNLNSADWNDTLRNQYDLVESDAKTYLKTAVANPNGDLLAQAMARYDYIVKKYGTVMFENFLDRTIPPSGAPLVSNSDTNNILIISLLGVVALISLAGFKLLSKKRRYS